MITDMMTAILGLSTGNIQDTRVADRAAVPTRKYNYTECSKVGSRYNS
jgi:hypothetical protein